jgi:predicted P-loop ATPase
MVDQSNTPDREKSQGTSRVSDGIPSPITEIIGPLCNAGVAVHWLRPRSKAPVDAGWSEAPVATFDKLCATYAPGNNLGVRLGEPSMVGDLYLHCLDIDVRLEDLADEASDALEELFPHVDFSNFPVVQSGSGGASRHFYFFSDKPFRSKRLKVSAGKHRRTKDHKDGWSYDYELELFGTGKQTAIPESIHPDTGKPYVWLKPFDWLSIELGDVPFIDSADIEALQVAEHENYAYESREPLEFKVGQLERVLDDIPVSDLHYDDWIRLGQAIHHQYGGSTEGFDLWLEHTRRSTKFVGDKQIREMRRVKWPSFGRYRGPIVTMASVVEWAKDARVAHLRDMFDEEDEEDDDDVVRDQGTSGTAAVAVRPVEPAFDPIDALGGDDPVSTDAGDPFDCLGDDETPEVDDIDAIGTLAAASPMSADGEWISLLDLNADGAIKPTLHNVKTIVCNDPRLVGLPQLNEFTQEVVQRRPPGVKANRRRNPAKPTLQLTGPVWHVKDTLNGDLWSDDRDFAIRAILEAPKTQSGYSLKVSDRDLKAAVTIAADLNRFNPVREYLEQLTWDGEPRAESLFIDYLGADDSPYSRGVGRLMLVAAVTRIYEPGHKFDHCVILEGLQGRRKSSFIRVLGRHWFGELDGNWDDKRQMIEQMAGKWILELPELSGFGRADVRTIKAFVSTQADRARLAYARRAGEFPRQCVFWGSTNDSSYLADETGGRRWWPMKCSVEMIDTTRLEANVDQIWAETLAIYRGMRVSQPTGTLPLYLSDAEAGEEALRLQETRRNESVEDVLAGQIEAWLEKPVETGSIDDDQSGGVRNETCVLEIWCDLMGKEASSLKQGDSQLIGRAMRKLAGGWSFDGRYADHGRFRKQRIWERGGIKGRMARM